MNKYLTVCLVFICLICSHSLFADDDDDDDDEISETAITIISQYPDYPATPGDIYNIDFLTGSNVDQTLTVFVDIEYYIDLSFIGKVNVKGMIYSDVQQILKDKILAAYPGSIVSVIIQAPGRFRVSLLGEVLIAEVLEANSLMTLYGIVQNKTTKYAGLRDIEIRSEDGSVSVYDLFQFSRYADKKNNPFLKPNDIITIRPSLKIINITGEVKKPGSYQLVKGDTLDTLINSYADGFTKIAEISNIEIKRTLKNNDEYEDTTIYINGNNIDLATVELSDYDVIKIDNRTDYNPKVVIQGAITGLNQVGTAVSNKIPVSIEKGSKVSTVLSNMSGSFNLSSDLENSFILRDGEKISINLRDIQNNTHSKFNIIMKNKDIMVVPFRQLHVYVAGSVNSSGSIPFIENRTAKYYIGVAGGFNLTESLFRSYSVWDVYGKKVKKNAIISPEDTIWVIKDHPMAYISEYGGWAISIAAIIIAADGIDKWVRTLDD